MSPHSNLPSGFVCDILGEFKTVASSFLSFLSVTSHILYSYSLSTSPHLYLAPSPVNLIHETP